MVMRTLMRDRLFRFSLLLALASTAIAAPAGGPAPTVQFWPPHITLYSGETASIRTFFFGDWGSRATTVALRAKSDIITVPAKVEAVEDRTASFEVQAWKPGAATVEALLYDRRSQVTVMVLAQEVLAISPARASTSGGHEVTIGGLGFSSACTVWFDDLPARQVTLVDRQTMVATTPEHSAGPANVRIFCGAHENVVRDAFEFVAPRRQSVRH
jgi:hypothetical protein